MMPSAFTEEDIDSMGYWMPDDPWCKNCETRRSQHADVDACLFSPTRFKAMTREEHSRWWHKRERAGL